MFETKKEQFRLIAKIEGWSFLILLFIAMPLKYMAGIAIATKIVGMAHGALWIGYLWLQSEASKEVKWGLKFNIFAFIMSVTPFGTIYLDKKLKQMDTKPALEESN
ncbi:MAG: DUF3817 domain-containing protein [Campylobacterota bacterium]|nr:DUF3817 domain-containing protein [Campylobacterota bacterium]